ncbi:MAG TPA: DUF4123 domain-containing protein [Denitromonas sp.]|uniref:DUF4123 domain-containing protein n=1 Tax=Denitromonas sp. TaxID=2734609 RepID=UPI001DF0F957|nr:DUF4123 domain-containing protein [Rhodocyclaceae bacterium]MCP5221858.1 DUF4123 domain-containing protein [Zoogloeaceae bacterium]HPR08798.1 DUF4123 domain-containing protein [Denitromonas sp.]HQU89525.1 DUF4123 domain-containing protein [Denitromonas sp.]HQV15440.1 DUF4123 domain-containing protein [Denitromonas sp.]
MQCVEPMQFAQWVAEEIRTPVRAGVRRYLFIDLSAMHDSGEANRFARVGPAVDVLRLQAPDWSEGAAPVVIDLTLVRSDTPPASTLRRVLSRWACASFAAFLESGLPLETLAARLNQRMEATLDDGTDVLWRLFDCRVFEALLDVLDPAQRAIVFSGISRWAFQQRDGTVGIPHHTVAPPGDTLADTAPLSLTEAQQIALATATEPDSIIDLMLRHGSPRLASLRPHEQYARIRQALDSARAYGIFDAPDQAAWCSLDLALGADFHTQLPWVERLNEIKEKRMTFSQALDRAVQDESAP